MSANFGEIIDYFGLSSAALEPISSDNGDVLKRLTVTHTGKIESGVGETSGIWRNPTVTYRVVADTTVSLKLGAAFAKATGRSGYMITRCELKTKVGDSPILTVTATANEGANAINLFQVTIPVEASYHAQNLMSAANGDDIELVEECSLVATCNAVVCEEANMPCASDVTNGRVMVSMTVVAADVDTIPRASSGWTRVREPKSGKDSAFPRYLVNFEKDLA